MIGKSGYFPTKAREGKGENTLEVLQNNDIPNVAAYHPRKKLNINGSSHRLNIDLKRPLVRVPPLILLQCSFSFFLSFFFFRIVCLFALLYAI